MKHNILITVIADVVLLVIGCTREEVTPAPEPTTPIVRNVNYVQCSKYRNSTVTGEEEWRKLLGTLFDYVYEGCAVYLWDADYAPDSNQTKTGIIYRTAVSDSAYEWIETLFDQHYMISIGFDQNSQLYVCSASEMTSQPEFHSFLWYLMQVVGNEQLLIINSQAELDSLLPGCFLPSYVDFDTQTLLAAHGPASCTVASVDTNIEYTGNDVLVTITVTMSYLSTPDRWMAAFACDKITDNQNVSLVVNIIDPSQQ